MILYMNNNNNVNKQKQQLSKELASLIEDYKNNLLKVRELYFKIEDKAIKEEGYTEDEIALLLDQKYKEALATIKKKKETININNNNNNTISSTIATTNNNKNEENKYFQRYFQHFQ